MKTELNKTRNGVKGLSTLHEYLYENIFRMYKEGNYFAYNISKKINFPKNLREDTFNYVRIQGKVSWTQLSLVEYGTIKLWWLICVASGIMNPVILPRPGSIVKIVNPDVVRAVLDQVNTKINQ